MRIFILQMEYTSDFLGKLRNYNIKFAVNKYW